jgi:membrane protein required for colicin V production
MAIDIIFIVLMLAALIRGMRRGLIVAVFSLLACIIGLAAAIKLSVVVADHLKNEGHIHSKWLPILAFILVFVAVVFLVRWIANLIEGAVDIAFMGWLNKMAGAILYMVLYISVYSIILFYCTRAHIISANAINSSAVYRFIEPWGPAIVNEIGKIIPIFRNMFAELEDFFSNIARRTA